MIVTDNLFGDIVADVAASVTGGIGLAASGNLDVSGTDPSMSSRARLRPRHRRSGSRRPDRQVLWVGLLLDHLGHSDQARKVNAAVASTSRARPRGPVRTARSATGWRPSPAGEDSLREGGGRSRYGPPRGGAGGRCRGPAGGGAAGPGPATTVNRTELGATAPPGRPS